MNAHQAVAELIALSVANGLRVATAESCTGGLVAAAITSVAGASAIFDCGFVTYANRAKTDILGVPDTLLSTAGAVSEEVAVAMAEGAMERAGVSLTVAVTGIAGPSGGTALKPIGLVHVATARAGRPTIHERHLFPDHGRESIRQAALSAALALLLRSARDV